MPIQIILALFLVFLLNPACTGQTMKNNPEVPLKLVNSIILPDVKGRIDHMAFDKKRNIIYVAALGNNTIEAVDIKSMKIYTIKNFDEPQGISFVPVNKTIFIANGSNGTVDVYDAQSYKKITSVFIGDDADNVRYDSLKNIIYAGYGNGGIAEIDGAKFIKLADIRLPAHPESFQLDRKKIYVNVPDAHQIDVINLNNNSIEAKWELKNVSSNYPMSIDKKDNRLFIACRHPSKLLVINTENGNTIASININDDADDVFYDQNAKRIYISCGSGYIDIIKQTNDNNYEVVSKIPTRSGARTSLFIPELNSLVVAAPSRESLKAQLMIYEID